MAISKDKIICEEQEILDSIVAKLDKEMLLCDKSLTRALLEKQKNKDKCLPDTYGALLQANADAAAALSTKNNLMVTKNELYNCRIAVDTVEGGQEDSEEFCIGLHTYMDRNRNIIICSWTMPVCRHYLLDNAAEDFVGTVEDEKTNETYVTYYKLKMKRRVEIRFTSVKDVVHLFPLTEEEAEQILSDEFLQELLKRRGDGDDGNFRNIIFSIQKKQGEIIQLPYNSNIIVQGCAGSGKSMIMLHRLPVLLFDNQESLSRSNIYIISPSKAYIQMADSMREELEIADIGMGTLEQYYDLVLHKYGFEQGIYGDYDPRMKLNFEQEKYVYSSECVNDIQSKVQKLVEAVMMDLSSQMELFGIKKRQRLNNSYEDKIKSQILDVTDVLNANRSALKIYYDAMKKVMDQLDRLIRSIAENRANIERILNRTIEKEKRIIEKAKSEMLELDSEENMIAIKNREVIIEKSINIIKNCHAQKEEITKENDYINRIEDCGVLAERIKKLVTSYRAYEQSKTEDLYQNIECIDILTDKAISLSEKIRAIENPYKNISNIVIDIVDVLEEYIIDLMDLKEPHLNKDEYQRINDNYKASEELKAKLIENVFESIIVDMGFKIARNRRRKRIVSTYAPYLYTQITYQFQGSPKTTKETLISIDEAQGLAPMEIDLIRKINDNSVVLNLYGDEKQHIEGNKGIDSWSELNEIINFSIEIMNQNYRNCRQVTEYCNKRFNMDMHAINISSRGVHEMKTLNECIENLNEVFVGVPKAGVSAIILKDEMEVQYFLCLFGKYQVKFHDMTGERDDIIRNKWNVMTVAQSRGLEFSTVISISGNMTENEKYISYTRALDELYVYDGEYVIPQEFIEELKKKEQERIKEEKQQRAVARKEDSKNKSKDSKRKKNEDFSNSQVKAFFESNGLIVKDMRPDNGYLWVVGSENEIAEIVNEAMEKFNIANGGYMASPDIGNKMGWYSKTKK